MSRNIWPLLFLGIILFSSLVSAETVKVSNYVNDYANIISDAQESELNTILKQLYDSGVAQYSIVTVKSLEGRDIESYSLEVAQGKLGDTEKNNGLLLVVALDDKQYRFEVGRGLEATLNDAKIGRVGRTYLVPNFQAEDYGKGIVEASKAVNSILLGQEPAEMSDISVHVDLKIVLWLIIFFIFMGYRFYLFYKLIRRKDKYFSAVDAAILVFGHGRGGLGGSGGSGGFGGFGGGGFGGGGAGGRW
jgi:uncharacterized protein